MSRSPASLIASDETQAKAFLDRLSAAELAALKYDWRGFWARPNQVVPDGDWWTTWLLLSGRGFGKSRCGAEAIRELVENGVSRHIALIAPTTADIRTVMVEGPSGILARSPPWNRPSYEPSKRHRLTWRNGAVAHCYSAEEPDRLRGPQHDTIWADELAAWQDPDETWDMAMLGLRIGARPLAIVTTTPRPIPIIREMLAGEGTSVFITRGRTSDNRENLAQAFFSKIVTKYEGTRLGRQELDGEVIGEVEGALWTREMIEAARGPVPAREALKRIVVGIDPAASSGGTSALTGIVAAGLGFDNRGYLLSDKSGRYSPAEWAKKATDLFDTWKADRVIAEGNQGGEMVRHTLQTARPNLPVRIVHASQGKQARAEPVAALSEQRRITFCGTFSELEDQLCTWAPLEGLPSPDRLDAFVWAFTDLMLSGPQGVAIVPPIIVSGPRPGV